MVNQLLLIKLLSPSTLVILCTAAYYGLSKFKLSFDHKRIGICTAQDFTDGTLTWY